MIKKILKKILPNFLSKIIILFFNKKNSLKNKKILESTPANFKSTNYYSNYNILSELCEKYGSDKGFVNQDSYKTYNWRPHSYTTFYDSIFSLSRDNIKRVFELGVGTNNVNFKSNMTENGKPGASLRVWRDYFINADIYGADIDKDILFKEERIKTFHVDQLDQNSIKKMWNNIQTEQFDIIIDDGLHELDASLNFFFNSFCKLRKNGIYIIEDVQTKNVKILQCKLKNYTPTVVLTSFLNKSNKFSGDGCLIFIKKN